MRRQRVTEAEVRGAVRKRKFGSMDEVEAIVMEANGEISVIQSLGDRSALGEGIEQQLHHHRRGHSRDADAP